MIYDTERELYLYQLAEADCPTKNIQGTPFQNEVSPTACLCANGSSAEIAATDVISISSSPLMVPECDQEESNFKIFQTGVKFLKQELTNNKPFLLDFPLVTSKCYRDKKTKHLTGHDVVHASIDADVVNSLLSKNIKYLPRFYTNKSENYSCAIADFDILPTRHQSWEAFRDKLSDHCENSGIVTTSRNGKAKVFFFFKGKLCLEQKKQYLKNKFSFVLGDNLWTMKCDIDGKLKYVIDKAGIEASFITRDMLDELKSKIQSIEIHNISFPSDSIDFQPRILKRVCVQKAPTWNVFNGDLPETIKGMNQYARYVFSVIAGNLKYATTRGMNFPIKHFANLSKYSSRDLCNALAELVKIGVLIKISNYKVGHHANSYKFDGFYLQWAKNELDKIRNGKSGKSLEQIMDSFEDGNWNSPLFDLAIYSIRHHWSRETYLGMVKRIPGWDEKQERIKQATSAYNSYSKWINRAASINLKIA